MARRLLNVPVRDFVFLDDDWRGNSWIWDLGLGLGFGFEVETFYG
jgi:hypothetical protein